MANSTLANLTASGALTGPELFYSDNGSADVKVTANQLKTFIVGAGSVSVASGKTLTVANTLTLAGAGLHGGVREYRHERWHGAAAQRRKYVLRRADHHASSEYSGAYRVEL